MLSESTPNSGHLDELEKSMLHALRMDHGHTTANEMQACKTCSRRARQMAAIAREEFNRGGTPNSERRRVAVRGDEMIRGVGVTSDNNGPFRLRFRIDGVSQAVTLDTSEWTTHWEDVYDAALATTGGETEWEERIVPMLDSSNTPYRLGYERRRKAGPWVAVDPTRPETTEVQS